MSEAFSEFLLLATCLIVSGFYSASEAALVSLSVDRTKQLIEEGGSTGKALEFLSRHANSVLTTILIGNNLINIFIASYSTNLAQRYLKNDALAVSVGLSTIFILLFGEIMPKTFARNRAEKLAVPVIRVLQVNYYLFYPVVMIFTWIIQKVLGKNAELSGRLVTKDDIEFMVNKAEKEKTIDSKQLDLLNSILEFPTIKVKDVMVPRNKIKYFSLEESFDEIKDLMMRSNHSRYPVCDEDLETVVGFLHVKDLIFTSAREMEKFEITRYLKPPFFVYEHMKIQAVFDHMNRKKVHLALVKDENGLVVGMITLEDIMEQIFGEIHDEHDDIAAKDVDALNEKTEDGIILEGPINLRDLYNEYDIKIPLNDNYSTLAGFLLDMIGNNFPRKGMLIFWEGYSFQIEKVVNSEIKEVKISDVEGDKHIYSKKFAEQESALTPVSESSTNQEKGDKDKEKDDKDSSSAD